MAAHSSNEATMRSLGTQSRRLTEGMKDLEKLNINTTLSSLPKYVVVGDQSAGKSSIVQALCGVSLPRSQGTTTRCPFRITTSKGTKSRRPWTCIVSLQQHSDLHGRGQWRRRDETNITHFATIYDEGDLEAVLRRAQLALLNPQEDPKHFLDSDWNKHTNNKAVFSPNVISLEIQASNLPELEFYDLPGCINSYDLPKSTKADAKQRQKEEKDLIQMIKSTVVSYIKEENCLILLACSADQDLEMSLTMKHIRDNDAEGRCIGVLTKADLVPSSKFPAILEILEGKKYQLEHPWFVTKQPSQQEIAEGLDNDAAREREIEFFATSPWIENISSRDQYGISQLSSQISLNLSDHILSEYVCLISTSHCPNR
jgi:GTPase SAR1 family protein